jgi:hypothetical protein
MGLRISLRGTLLFLAVASLAPPALACSVVGGYETFVPEPALRPSPTLARPPQVSVDSIRRGHAGDSGMCADLGFLVLKVPSGRLGYSFELVEGNFTGVFPKGFVQSVAPGFLSFVWIDGNTEAQEPIRAVVKITAMSITGALSEPLLLTIENPGRDRAR